ncbi:von Willebrand factor [Alienimonas californiensis]|uniref:von Willebrand factor n=1 Tax=Alienimonas californiensis TaxID=2527989 RepID=A0A517P6H2_9PLAN|nr:von Willebrand factor [Alienimonas californiensis]
MALLAALALAPTLSGCVEEAREAAVVSAPADEVAPAEASRPSSGPAAAPQSKWDSGGAPGQEMAEGEADSDMPVDAFAADAAGLPADVPMFESVQHPVSLNSLETAAPAEPMEGMPLAANAPARGATLKSESRGLRLNALRDAERLGEQEVELQTELLVRERKSDFSREQYAPIPENRFLSAKDTPLSTFAVDVDTASYANVRRFLNGGQLPPPGAVRIEELVNYFRYDYEPPSAEGAPAEGDGDEESRPFAVHAEVASCPWATDHRLVRIALKGREMETDARPLCNLVFLLDVSGSMDSADKLGLVKQAMTLLTQQLGENDKVSIVVYAGASGLALPPTGGDDPQAIIDALDNLAAGGSTNGGQGIELAYRTARENFIKGGVNRVILCTDGDFNVGVTDDSSLVEMIEEKAKAGVSLTVLGFGTGNYQDAKMEQLADKGDGNYGYIDDIREAKKMLVEQLTGTLVTIAKDVKIQADFNPAAVKSYRLIGYENRKMAAEDFRDDAKDAGEIGAGHSVTALYEVVPAGADEEAPETPQSKYQTPGEPTDAAMNSGELLTVNLRYKAPNATKEDPATEFNVPVPDSMKAFEEASADYRFAAAVAAFGMLLRNSEHSGTAKLGDAAAWAEAAVGEDAGGYREEFVGLAEQAARLGDR